MSISSGHRILCTWNRLPIVSHVVCIKIGFAFVELYWSQFRLTHCTYSLLNWIKLYSLCHHLSNESNKGNSKRNKDSENNLFIDLLIHFLIFSVVMLELHRAVNFNVVSVSVFFKHYKKSALVLCLIEVEEESMKIAIALSILPTGFNFPIFLLFLFILLLA